MKKFLIFQGMILLGALSPSPVEAQNKEKLKQLMQASQALSSSAMDLFDDDDFNSSLTEARSNEKEKGAESAPAVKPEAPAASASPVLSPPPASSPPPLAMPPLPTAQVPSAAPPRPPAAKPPQAPPPQAAPKQPVPPQFSKPFDGFDDFDGFGGGPPKGGKASLPKLGSRANVKPTDDDDDINVSIFERRRKKSNVTETDVSKFDIAGITLRMSPDAVEGVAALNGFSLKFKNKKVPTFLRWRYKDECMKQKVFAYADLQNCIDGKAKQSGNLYVEKLVFEKKEAREKLTVHFTSTFTGNVVFRVRYDNFGEPSWGTTQEGEYLKKKRRQDFFREIFQKYGAPDDEELLIWGGGDLDSASLMANITATFLDASLILEDLSLTDEDAEAMQIDDAGRKPMNEFNF